MTVVFTEGVYANSNATGSLAAASISSIADQTNVAISGSVSGSPTHTAGTATATYNVTWSPSTPAANVDQILVTAGTAIYDAAGNQIPGSSTGTGTAKVIRIFGVSLPAAGTGANQATRIASFVLNLLSPVNGPAGVLPPATSESGTETTAAPAAASPPRALFSVPVTSADAGAAVGAPAGAPASVHRNAEAGAAPSAASPIAAPTPAPSGTAGATPGSTRGLPPAISGAAPPGPGPLPAWWILGLGVCAAGGVTAAAWAALRFVRERSGR